MYNIITVGPIVDIKVFKHLKERESVGINFWNLFKSIGRRELEQHVPGYKSKKTPVQNIVNTIPTPRASHNYTNYEHHAAP